MQKICSLKEKIVQEIFHDSLLLISSFCRYYHIDMYFDQTEFLHFHYHIYSLYENKKEIYLFREQMRNYLYVTMFSVLEEGKTMVKIEDILDGIFYIKTNDEYSIEKTMNKALRKLHGIGGNYYG